MRKAARWLALTLVAATAVFGSINAIDEFGDGATFWQRSVGVAVSMYAILSWVLLLAVWRRRRWAVWIAVAWAVSATWAAAVSTVAWGNAPIAAAAGAGLSCVLLGAWVAWATRDALRSGKPDPAKPASAR
jgi:hypothetical protein